MMTLMMMMGLEWAHQFHYDCDDDNCDDDDDDDDDEDGDDG